MKNWLTIALQVLLFASLVAMPSNGVACPVAQISQVDMSCCGPSCPCPMGRTCAAVPSPAGDRVMDQTQPEVFGRALASLYSLSPARNSLSALSVSLAMKDIKAPPLNVAGPPQAKLRVWLL